MASRFAEKVLLVGESWMSSATHYKGFDQFGSVTFHTGADPLLAALKGSEFDVTHMKAHEAAEGFPFTMDGLAGYDALILSDIGANTLLLPPEVWLHSRTVPNRLKMIRDWVAQGGNLMMAGGYFSFQGIDGKARWRRTPVEDVLPVTCLPWDDRIEIPEGCRAELLEAGHAIFDGMDGDWPPLLGVNEVERKTARKFSPGCRRTRAGIRCLCSGRMEKAGRRYGRAISGRTGCRRNSAPGTATAGSGTTCSAG